MHHYQPDLPALCALLTALARAAPQQGPHGPPDTPDTATPRAQDMATADATPTPEWAICGAPGPAKLAWWHEAVGYEVFVRSLFDSDGDGLGDLAVLTAKLDFLNDGNSNMNGNLGVTLRWLMPIFDSPSCHGYDVRDFRKIAKNNGKWDHVAALTQAAHARGMRVIVDLPVNHSSDQHPWFQDAAAPTASAKRDWYVWSDTARSWKKPWGPGATWFKKGGAWYYGVFSQGMPDLNGTTAPVRAEMADTGAFWLGVGLDGFRLDAARYLIETGPDEGQADTPQTHAALAELRASLRKIMPEILLVGEIWTKYSVVTTYEGSPEEPELPMAFDFDVAKAMVDGIGDAKASTLRMSLCQRLGLCGRDFAAGTFLTNHDQIRLASALQAAGERVTGGAQPPRTVARACVTQGRSMPAHAHFGQTPQSDTQVRQLSHPSHNALPQLGQVPQSAGQLPHCSPV